MTTPDFSRIYARQEYLTPGAPRTVELIEEVVRPTEDTVLLDVASGKGEAAATLASHHACRVVCVEPYDPFVHYSTAKFWHFNLRDLVTVVRANGRRLPVRDASVDAAYCIGGPSIVGLEQCFQEMARAVRPGGVVVASDLTWRDKPGPLGPEWRFLATVTQLLRDEYAAIVESAGLVVESSETHGRNAWEDYWRPMLEVAEEAKTARPADVFFADEIEAGQQMESRAIEAWLDYTTFVARRP
jgi:ubiquinone/menaquinone biosynthesis C-methylase UbiE